mgnify:CR=1 FL=1
MYDNDLKIDAATAGRFAEVKNKETFSVFSQ